MAGFAANEDSDQLVLRRFEAPPGYGFAALGDRLTATPAVGFGPSESPREGTGVVSPNDNQYEHGIAMRDNMRW